MGNANRRTLTFFIMSFLLVISSPVVLASSNVKNILPDSTITLNIKAEMAKEPSLSATAITVETNNGIVNLTGKVKTDADAAKIMEIAESTNGVKDIETSNLIVAGGSQPLADIVITSKIKGLFVREKILGNIPIPVTDIQVETKDGVVYLRGQVKDEQQAKNAIRIAKSVNGVKNVKSEIKVKK